MSDTRRWPMLDATKSDAHLASASDYVAPGDPEDAAQLKKYQHAKHEIAHVLRSIQRLVPEQTNSDHERQCRELMVKLAEDRFTLAVVGQFKRGKSSLMNAIIGHELLPTGILPLTSTITVVRFGVRERLVVRRDGSIFEEEAPVSALPDYVTEQGNPGNQKKIQAVYVETPSPFLRRGLEFVDTPGIGSAIEANTETTMKFIPQCDAVLFVTGVDSPLTSDELYFLKRIRDHVRKIFFVVNKMDLAGEQQKQDVLSFVATTLSKQMDGAEIRLFPVSSRMALSGKESDAHVRLQSGIGTLEVSLAHFLTTERSEAFLLAIIDKAVRLIASTSASTIFQGDIDCGRESLENRLQAIQKAIIHGTEIEHATLATTPAPALSQDTTTNLASDLTTRGCPVCKYLTHVAFEYFAKWQHALASDEAAQQAYAQWLGFCPLHVWQLAGIASPLGLSVGYPKLAQTIAEQLATIRESSESLSSAVRNLVCLPGACHACQLLNERERAYTKRIAESLDDLSFRDAYTRSQGACLRHLASVISFTQPQTARWLLANASQRFTHLAEDMQNYAMKRDALRRTLLNPDEDDAYLRAMIHISGDRHLCSPAPMDAEI